MYRVNLRYKDFESLDKNVLFDCEDFYINRDIYEFKNIVIDQCILNALEIKNEDITFIKIM
ncbi:hypothetical protein [Paraclostridium sordellii]|uniref:Uncharacterized protein n=1 Tax=Paraclostridium sordellii TaxID=1505 RepID=A0A0C7HYA8_PARSO|nr:hypothetical protein [Paeniclostridium sordellii]CEN79720.1 Uncharacterised protein [[Clostridium] sordellii] [Paeniclostridium sordellii]CEO05301.1 Uncharacterised protein [[Clostridium] sordellii] [Paeniclostridium sordellii]CEP85988.1 Uncharacterised protein [[Clostridium] sordellii] [Paeniclostridium sordellii]CEP96240.1 Uncharacterised protein [[Clostridium] sordellii] [Paeniclostridium sordellii]CEQ00293.1 Uncharacterised protein [[Clostridium] sordellii] [Paeniclostridium sordellii]